MNAIAEACGADATRGGRQGGPESEDGGSNPGKAARYEGAYATKKEPS